MFERLFSLLGYLPGLSGLSGLANQSGGEDGFEAEGEAKVAFQSGVKIAASDEEETTDERRARITDRDLVWPGKTETIQISNPEAMAYRFDLTVTDLAESLYLRRPVIGGTPHRDGGVVLQPGQEASFDVVFMPPPAGEKTRTRTFSFVLTCFDPRRSTDPGEIVQDLPLRWVALPSTSDLQISALPPLVVTRPWRREAKFSVKFLNKSYLPPSVGLTILRAPTKDGLERGGETVGTIEQSLAARTPGSWSCVLPPLTRRGSYYATVRGVGQTAEAHSSPLALPRPVVVRYIPWLRMGRDWLFLLGLFAFLFWLAWGLPIRKTPIVRVSLAFAGLDKGQVPADSRLEDLESKLIFTDERGHDLEGQSPIPGAVLGDAYEFKCPPRWFGLRWFFGDHLGWNGFSRVPQHFRVALSPAESEKAAFKRFDLNTLLPDGTPAYDVGTAASAYGTWVTPATYVVQSAHGVFVNLRLGDLGALSGKELHRVNVAYALDGEEQPARTFQLLHDAAGHLRPLTLDLTDAMPLGTSKQFTVKVTANGLSSYDAQPLDVRRQDKPFSMTLSFPHSYPKTAGRPGADPPVVPRVSQTGLPNSPGGGVPPGGGTSSGGGLIKPFPVILGGRPPISTGPGIGSLPHNISPIRPATQIGTMPGETGTGSSISPPPKGPPPTPAGLTVQVAGQSQIAARWNHVPGAEKYILYRSAAPGQHFDGQRFEKILGADVTNYTDSDLAPGIIYFYRIQAKSSYGYSPVSPLAAVMTRPLSQAPALVTLRVTPRGRDLQAELEFTNVSSQPVYIDKTLGCLDGKIGEDVFQITADGQPVPYSGKKTSRPSDPGPRQFIALNPNETRSVSVNLNRSYRLPPGAHTYNVTYLASHNYPARMQSLTLRSGTERMAQGN